MSSPSLRDCPLALALVERGTFPFLRAGDTAFLGTWQCHSAGSVFVQIAGGIQLQHELG